MSSHGKKANRVHPEEGRTENWVHVRSGVDMHIKNVEPSSTSGLTVEKSSIFFIHGVAGSSDVWELQMKFFSNLGFHVIALDLIGHGLSSAPNKSEAYLFSHIAQDCLYVFDKYCQHTNHIIAHSYGTSFAAYIAHHRPAKVERLVLMSGGGPYPLAPQGGVLSLPSPILSCLHPALRRIFHRHAFHEKNKLLRNKAAAFAVPLYVLRHTMSGQLWPDGDGIFHKNLKQPVLLLHGSSDMLEHYSTTLDMHKVLRRSKFYIVDDASHMIMMEQPVIVNTLILQFLCDEASMPEQDCSFDQGAPSRLDLMGISKSVPNLQ